MWSRKFDQKSLGAIRFSPTADVGAWPGFSIGPWPMLSPRFLAKRPSAKMASAAAITEQKLRGAA